MGYTFTMIKPKVVAKNQVGAVLNRMEEGGFRIVAMKKTWLSLEEAAAFYEEHDGKPFFSDLIEFMSSGPIVAIVLESDSEDTIGDFRKLIGSTDPTAADDGTIRKDFAESKTYNAVHGSDSPESFERESSFYFSLRDWC